MTMVQQLFVLFFSVLIGNGGKIFLVQNLITFHFVCEWAAVCYDLCVNTGNLTEFQMYMFTINYHDEKK